MESGETLNVKHLYWDAKKNDMVSKKNWKRRFCVVTKHENERNVWNIYRDKEEFSKKKSPIHSSDLSDYSLTEVAPTESRRPHSFALRSQDNTEVYLIACDTDRKLEDILPFFEALFESEVETAHSDEAGDEEIVGEVIKDQHGKQRAELFTSEEAENQEQLHQPEGERVNEEAEHAGNPYCYDPETAVENAEENLDYQIDNVTKTEEEAIATSEGPIRDKEAAVQAFALEYPERTEPEKEDSLEEIERQKNEDEEGDEHEFTGGQEDGDVKDVEYEMKEAEVSATVEEESSDDTVIRLLDKEEEASHPMGTEGEGPAVRGSEEKEEGLDVSEPDEGTVAIDVPLTESVPLGANSTSFEKNIVEEDNNKAREVELDHEAQTWEAVEGDGAEDVSRRGSRAPSGSNPSDALESILPAASNPSEAPAASIEDRPLDVEAPVSTRRTMRVDHPLLPTEDPAAVAQVMGIQSMRTAEPEPPKEEGSERHQEKKTASSSSSSMRYVYVSEHEPTDSDAVIVAAYRASEKDEVMKAVAREREVMESALNNLLGYREKLMESNAVFNSRRGVLQDAVSTAEESIHSEMHKLHLLVSEAEEKLLGAVHTAEQAVKVDISNGEKEFEDTLAEINGLAADMSRVLNHHESKSELFPLLGRIEAMLRDESGSRGDLTVGLVKKAEQKVQSKADIFLSKVEKMKTDDERRVTGFLPHPIKDALADVRRKSATFTPAENFVHHVDTACNAIRNVSLPTPSQETAVVARETSSMSVPKATVESRTESIRERYTIKSKPTTAASSKASSRASSRTTTPRKSRKQDDDDLGTAAKVNAWSSGLRSIEPPSKRVVSRQRSRSSSVSASRERRASVDAAAAYVDSRSQTPRATHRHGQLLDRDAEAQLRSAAERATGSHRRRGSTSSRSMREEPARATRGVFSQIFVGKSERDDGSWVPLAVSIQSIKQRSSAATGSAGSSRDSRVGSRAGSRSSSRATSPQGQRPGTSVLGSFDSHETTRTPATRLSFHSNIGGSVSLSCIGSDHFPFEVGMDDIIYVIGRTEVEDVFLGYTSILQGCRGSIPPISARKIHLRTDILTKRPGGSILITLVRRSPASFVVAQVQIAMRDVPQESVLRWLQIEQELESGHVLDSTFSVVPSHNGDAHTSGHNEAEEEDSRAIASSAAEPSAKAAAAAASAMSWPIGSWVADKTARSAVPSAQGSIGLTAKPAVSSPSKASSSAAGAARSPANLTASDLSPIPHRGSPSGELGTSRGGEERGQVQTNFAEVSSFQYSQDVPSYTNGDGKPQKSEKYSHQSQSVNGRRKATVPKHVERGVEDSLLENEVAVGWISGKARFCVLALTSEVKELKKRLAEKGLAALENADVSEALTIVGMPYKLRVQGDEDSGRHTEVIADVGTGSAKPVKVQRGKVLYLVGIVEVTQTSSTDGAESKPEKTIFQVVRISQLLPENLSVDPRLSASLLTSKGESGYLALAHLARPLLSCKVPIQNPKPCGYVTFVGQKLGGPKTPTRLLHVVISMAEWRYVGGGKSQSAVKTANPTRSGLPRMDAYVKVHGTAVAENDPNLRSWAMQLRQ